MRANYRESVIGVVNAINFTIYVFSKLTPIQFVKLMFLKIRIITKSNFISCFIFKLRLSLINFIIVVLWKVYLWLCYLYRWIRKSKMYESMQNVEINLGRVGLIIIHTICNLKHNRVRVLVKDFLCGFKLQARSDY